MNISTDTTRQNEGFARVPTISTPRNTFSLIKKGCTTHQFDNLHVIYTKEILPGDTINLQLDFFARLQTQITDLFDDLLSDVHIWFGANRLVQTNWARFFYDSQITGPTQDNSALTTPRIEAKLVAAGDYQFETKSLFDDMEYPVGVKLTRNPGTGDQTIHIPNYKCRHYNNIFNLNYRDQNLQNARVVDYDEGPDAYNDYYLHAKRGKRHDMPSSCLPFIQKGTAPLVPMTGTVPVIPNAAVFPEMRTTNIAGPLRFQTVVGNPGHWSTGANIAGTEDAYWTATGMQVNLAAATAGFYINDMRFTIAVQHLLEANARGGTRDVEALANVWSVDVVDFRMDRPEYLGGSTFSFDGHVVPQTSETATTPQAHLASFSQQRSSMRVMHSFVEPGFLMILVSHRSNQTYQNFLKKEDTRQTRYDYFNPFFANLGETAVKTRELWVSGTAASDDAIFGYQRFGYEYIYDINTVTREMRSIYATSLDSKHMAYDFATSPVLNSSFIESSTPIDRNIVVASSVADPIQINFKVSGTIARQIPLDSIPGLTRI